MAHPMFSDAGLSIFPRRATLGGVSALRLLPPLGWTVVILWLSTGRFAAAETAHVIIPWLEALLPWLAPEQLDALHWLLRKGAHLSEYALLAALWRLALAPGGRAGWKWPLGLSILTAAVDELHQAITLSRGASVADVLLDAAGASGALIVAGGGAAIVGHRLTGGLLWVAAAGGTMLIALNWSAGVPSRWLWWSVPGAWVALVLWLRGRWTP